ncbi:AMP-binding protein [Pseudomonas aeruginosa]|uniref:AMP-binding protein n=1 Tax=Pseudomonas aeruginosa TaxID=287 RepID=UPI001551AA4C|nr:AMP-binding protein [Pseudomonas aeruginosa]QKF01633.1 AMP-binding protein [Pseudomonas aeruginosa]HCF1525218.1 AMP-binding protein [Pseudomonas aeruginosa]
MHLNRLFQRSVRMHGQRPALVRGRGEPITYAQLDLRVRALARWLRHDLGLARGDRVVLAMKNYTEYAEALLALWTAGLCAVPVNNKLHPQEVAYILENSDSRLCLSSGDLLEQLRPVAAKLPGLAMVDVRGDAWQQALTGEPLPCAEETGSDYELAWLFYTSGTTGRPKGVMLTHANLVAMSLNFFADVLAIDEHDVLVHVAPMSHGGGLYGIAYMLRGSLQVVPESGGFDEAELFDLLAHYQKVSLFAAPTIVLRMVEHAKRTRALADAPVCPGLRCLITGGAPFYVEDIKAAVQCFGPRIAQVYGQGETPMTISALSAVRIAQAVEEGDGELLASVGYPQTTVEIEILDSMGHPVTPGTLGEVTVRSPTVMRGYWSNPEATAQTMPDGVLHTGDVGFLDTRGLLHLRDRSKDVIISGGTNIYPREVEEVLLRHPEVEEVSVIGTPDPEWGEAVTAVVVVRNGSSVDQTELDTLCLESIARFKRPKHYVFMEALPKNATGKVLKNQLRQAIADQVAPKFDAWQL